MSLDPELTLFAERLIPMKCDERTAALRDDLLHRENEAVEQGTAGTNAYARAQMNACIHELNERAEAIWVAYRTVISEARVAWSAEVREVVVQRIKSETEPDIGYIEEMARDVIVRHGHGFELFLRNRWPDMLARIETKVDLFGINQRPVPGELITQLSSPRYAGPAIHWRRTQEALVASPPDLVGAAREAIHTVESLAKVLTGKHTATLGDCIRTLKSSNVMPAAVAKQMDALWGYSSNLESVRHGSSTGDIPGEAELLFVVGSAEASSKFLLSLDRPSD